MAPTTPTRWQRVKAPLAGLAIAVIFSVLTYSAATNLASGGSMPRARGRGAIFVELSYALARLLGVQGTAVAGAIGIAIPLVLIARALRLPAGPGSVQRAPVMLAPQRDVIDAFDRIRYQQRRYSAAQFGVVFGVAFFGIKLSSAPAVTPVDATGFLALGAALVGVTVLKARAWKCPACGGAPGPRVTRMCASCGAPLAAGLIDERVSNLLR